MKLSSRRYIGSKSKLLDWIFSEIEKNTNAKSFFDAFSGTGCVAERALTKYEKVIVNDILYSNKLIYDAIWENKPYDIKKIKNLAFYYNNLDSKNLSSNYFSMNFGNKYFGENDARKIGFIRDNLEFEKNYRYFNAGKIDFTDHK